MSAKTSTDIKMQKRSVYSSLSETEESEVTTAETGNFKTIYISLESYLNIIGVHPIGDIQTSCKYLDRDLGSSDWIPITDDTTLSVNHRFTLQINRDSEEEVDNLIANPVVFNVYQAKGTFDSYFYEQLKEQENAKPPSISSYESAISMYEAFTGQLPENQHPVDDLTDKKNRSKQKLTEPKPKNNNKKGRKSSKGSLVSQGVLEAGHHPSLKDEVAIVPELYGICVLDLLPILYGKRQFAETIPIKPLEVFMDERMLTFKKSPKMVVKISCDDFEFPKDFLMLNYTIESIYNIPGFMKPDMSYNACTVINRKQGPMPIVFKNFRYEEVHKKRQMKCWKDLPPIGENSNTTNFSINSNYEEVSNKVINLNLIKDVYANTPRLECNSLMRVAIFDEENETYFKDNYKQYKKMFLEVFISTKPDEGKTSKKPEPAKAKKVKEEEGQIFHLMSIVDTSMLSYPGIKRIRVAAPLVTYNSEDAAKFCGITESYFMKGQVRSVATFSEEDKVRKLRTTDDIEGSDVQKMLPNEPKADMESKTKIFSDDGKPCFVIVEVELSKPVEEVIPVEDLHHQLEFLVKKRDICRIALTSCISRDYYHETISELAKKLYDDYHEYQTQRNNCFCENQADFITYLQRTGNYQKYMATLSKAASVVVTNEFHYSGPVNSHNKEYQNFVGEVYVYLISEMNNVLNRLVCTGLEPSLVPPQNSMEDLLFYAKEASELGNATLAEKYYLQRICSKPKNTNYLFDFAIFKLQEGQRDLAMQCIQDSLELEQNRNSLLLFAIMLTDENKREAAETCFLSLLVSQRRWVEGWGIMYLHYQKYENYEGMEMSLSKAVQFLNDRRSKTDYFDSNEDLAWNSKILPNTVFFRVAIILLKMRLYEWTELALSMELEKNYGIVSYMLATICYYRKMYEHALDHINEAKFHHGSDVGVASLAGHIYFALKKFPEAKAEYVHIIQAFSKQKNLHLTLVNYSKVLEILGEDQEARKFILLSCKQSATPYTWFRAGLLYYNQKDFISAEECWNEANVRDNRNPEIWGYLALINQHLHRFSEAELCYRHALQNKLENKDLLDKINYGFEKYNKIHSERN